jgi:hypothetical protein
VSPPACRLLQSEDKSVVIWRCDDWSVVECIKARYARLVTSTFSTRMSWSPDGTYLATGGWVARRGVSLVVVVVVGWCLGRGCQVEGCVLHGCDVKVQGVWCFPRFLWQDGGGTQLSRVRSRVLSASSPPVQATATRARATPL